MKYIFITLFFFCVLAVKSQEPLTADFQNSAWTRWLGKEVLQSRSLDDMEGTNRWISFTGGAIALADSRIDRKEEVGKMDYVQTEISAAQKHQGNNSLKMVFPSKLEIPAPKSGRGWCPVGIRYKVDNEDWTKFNRISVWIFPDNPGAYSPHLELRLFNDGTEKLPALFGQEGESIFNLKNHEWNHIVWEIGNVARDKITSVEISTSISGHEPEACDSTTFYFDDLALEKVDPDYIEGWPVWKGRIAYSHTGYMTRVQKLQL